MTTTGLLSVISLAFIVSLCLVHYSSATGSHTTSSWASMIPRSRYSFVNTICEGRTKTIRCVSAGHVILIEDAFYGRRDGSTCPSSTIRTRRCKSSKALPILWARCNGRRSCTITASNTRFQGDPCRGTYKYVQLQFRCGNPGTDTVGTCFANSWGSWLDIDNPSGTGDYELLSTHRSRSRSACTSPTGMQIQMKTGGSYTRAGNAVRNSLSYGMTCLNSEQSLMPSRTCKDYKVRYCCRGGASGIPCRRPTIPSGVNAWPSSKSTFNTNEYIRFTCPSGKTLSGGVSRTTCQANGAWLPSRIPTCVTSSSGCRGLARFSHGTITPRRTSWPVGSMATFTCDSGYSLVGRSPIRCMSNGQWSGSAPTCAVVSRDCGGEIVGQTSGRIQSPNYPNNYPNHKDCTWEITVNAGQTIEITIEKFALEPNRRCRYDYLEIFNGTSRNTRILKLCGFFTRRTYRSTGRSATLRFHSDSSVNKKGFDIRWRAVGAGCPAPTAPSYGTVSPSRSQHNPGDYVTYSCRTGYRLVGQARVRCGSSGSWSSSAPTCERRDPVTPTFKSCYAVGDPHYCTFDGKRFDYQGVCSYVLVKASSVPHGSNLRPFVVEVDNEHRGGNTRVSWLRKVIVRVGGIVIELLKGKVVQVDSETVNLPFSHPSSGVNIKFSGRFVVLTTSFQMKIIYDGKSYLTVRMPSTYSGIVEGLCGNYNGNPDDDFTRRGTRIILTDPTQFGNQFQTSSKPGCTRALPPRDETCPSSRKSVFRRQCSIITEENGCFASCHSLADPAPFLRDCVFDACVYNDALAALENNVGSYAQICQALGARICPEWRNTTNTPLSCGPNSHYNPCGSSCPRTCSQPRTVSCDRQCVEQCECDSGYVLSGDTCVRTSECGCSQNGKYYKNGDVTYTSGCGRKCTCQRGRMTCVRARCGSNERCGRDVFGRVACVPTGYGLCKAWGDPHYMTFDGSGWFDFMGTCSYTMARTNTLSTNDQRWFHVVATNEHRGSNTRVSFIKHITVTLFGGTVAVRLEKNRVVKVNGNVVASYHSPRFSIQISGRSTLLSTEHGLKVWFNGNGVRVKIPSTYKGQVHGVCGDYNGIKSDDLKTSGGVVTADFNEFAQSYQIGNCSDRIPEPFTCSNSERQRWSAEEFCGSLTARTGVFRPCHHTIDANTFFQKCVFDVCASNGDTTVLEQALEIYSEVCQAHDVELCDWRSRTNTRALRCPVYSHYEGCASACTDTCEEPYASSNCHIHGKVEACVCDVGYVRDGDNCIRKSECGCRVGNYYIRRGQRLTIPREYKVCTCLGQNRVRCTCSAGYTGSPCRDINECLSNPCDENASCTNTRGSFRCECDAGYNGNGFDCSAAARCAPEAILYGSYYPRSSNPRSVGSSIRYSCFRGYEIIGQAVLTCEEGGDWSHDFPTCAGNLHCANNVVMNMPHASIYLEDTHAHVMKVILEVEQLAQQTNVQL
ncbi:IgGFc-binding protein-like [Ciona intestinalis]